jgi:DNA-directed RNA polymerase specialized sigma24 family protein
MEGLEITFDEFVDRYADLVCRTSLRILCDRGDSEFVTMQVFSYLWHGPENYAADSRMKTVILEKTCHFCRVRIARRSILKIFGITGEVYVNVAPKADDADDYQTKMAWELHCRAVAEMTFLQASVYALCVLEEVSEDAAARILGVSQAKVSGAAEDASDKVRTLLADYGRDYEYDRYNGFIRKVADGLTDMNILKKMIIFAAEN